MFVMYQKEESRIIIDPQQASGRSVGEPNSVTIVQFSGEPL